MERYDFAAIEERWAEAWERDRAWTVPRVPGGPKQYVLEMFPYPSGDMHVGHVRNFTIGDAIARYLRMRGYEVLHPFGYDAFGLPAENAAIQHGEHPREWTTVNIEQFTASCKRLGFSYDWSRMLKTCDPEYYRWNQWFFLRFYERGLAYRKLAKVKWCPSCQTVLADEQTASGGCWRCGSPPEVRDLPQWFLRITAYADRLLEDMAGLEWSEAVLQQQRNWIGWSEGLQLRFRIVDLDEEVPVFTTRPETLWGVTFLALAPEHPLARRLAERAGKLEAYEGFLSTVRRVSEIERLALGKAKRVFDLEAYAVHPLSSHPVPVVTAECVLLEHGTGAVMGVPAHDQRDFELARQLGLPIRVVVQPRDGESLDPEAMKVAFVGEGVMVGSGWMDGLPSEEARRLITADLVQRGMGRRVVHYRLRDWLISRQRYWGTPIPIVYCQGCGAVPVPDDQLPVLLPEDVDYRPTGEAVSPLASVRSWVETTCPACGGHAQRETDTMDTFVDSSWYFLRFCDPQNSRAPFDPELAAAWMPVDQYIGGVEHAVLHLIYARFFTKVLFDMNLVPCAEPFRRLLNHGMITMGGKAMSKSRGNVVDPREVVARFGADALRLYVLFAAPPEQDHEWPPEGAAAVAGMHRFLRRVWQLVTGHLEILRRGDAPEAGTTQRLAAIHRLFAAITKDYERHAFNTAIAKLMELFQEVRAAARAGTWAEFRAGTTMLLHALAPMAPFIAEELWQRMGGEGSIHRRPWPRVDPELARAARQTLVVQVNGRVRDRLEVEPDITEEEAVRLALASDRVKRSLGNKTPVRIVARPPRFVNVVLE